MKNIYTTIRKYATNFILSFLQRIQNFIGEKNLIAQDTNVADDEPKEVLNISSSEDELFFNNDVISSFLEDFIGIIILDIVMYNKTRSKISKYLPIIKNTYISKVLMSEMGVTLSLSSMDNRHVGDLRMPFGTDGEVSDGEDGEDATSSTIYRIIFFGGDYIEYSDSDVTNVIEFEG